MINKIALQNFISKLDFIKNPENVCENITISNEMNTINGIIGLGKNEEIFFESTYRKTDDVLEFQTTYQLNHQYTSEVLTETDTFIIANSKNKFIFSPRIKYLLHIVNGNLKQAYIVNKKYNFDCGISENYTKLNMDNKEVLRSIPNKYQNIPTPTNNNYRR